MLIFLFVLMRFQSKIVRVLNLWQKNAVFKSDIIQPLLDMAAGIPPPSVTPVIPSSAAPVNNTTPGQLKRARVAQKHAVLQAFSNVSLLRSVSEGTPATPATPANIVQGLPDWASQITNTDTMAAVAQILQSPQGQQVSRPPAASAGVVPWSESEACRDKKYRWRMYFLRNFCSKLYYFARVKTFMYGHLKKKKKKTVQNNERQHRRDTSSSAA